MSLIALIFIAFGLAMDAFAVSVTIGSVYKKPGHGHALSAAAAFGLFQAMMPVLGWAAGVSVREYIAAYDHWIAFCLLCFVGGKMIYESFQIHRSEDNPSILTFRYLVLLAVATSMDALAVGITLSVLLEGFILAEVIVIGMITFALSYAGVIIGKFFGHIFESRIEIFGGLVLIAIGFEILIEHLFFR